MQPEWLGNLTWLGDARAQDLVIPGSELACDWLEASPPPRQESPFFDRGLAPEDIVPMWKATEARNNIAMLPDLVDSRLPEEPRFDGRRHQPAFG